VLHAVCEQAPGTPGRPLTADEIKRKFRENAALAISTPQVDALEAGVLGLDAAKTARLSF
jgi:hypothetical protein